MKDRYPRLTPMRAFNLLETINRRDWTDEYKLRECREALSNHVKAALTAKNKRKRAKVVKLTRVA